MLQCIGLITVGLVCQNDKKELESVCCVLSPGDVMNTKKGVIRE